MTQNISVNPMPPIRVDPPTDLATAVADAKYASMTHAEIADDLNGQTVDVPRTIATLADIYNVADPGELATWDHPGFWKLLDQQQFDLSGKQWALLLAMSPPKTQAAMTDFSESTITVSLVQAMGYTRPMDYGDVSAVLGFEPDLIDLATGEKQNAAGLSSDQRQAMLASNARQGR